MGAVATSERPARARRAPRRRAGRLFEPARGGRSLEQAIVATWERLRSEGRAGCPVCAQPVDAGHPCGSCGSALL